MHIQHDRPLDVALGNTRKTKTWKNKPMLWSELLDRLSTTTRTAETVAEYKAMNRNRQSGQGRGWLRGWLLQRRQPYRRQRPAPLCAVPGC